MKQKTVLIVALIVVTVTLLIVSSLGLRMTSQKHGEAQSIKIRFVEANIVQGLKGGIVVTDELGAEYYIEFDRWLHKTGWGEDFYRETSR